MTGARKPRGYATQKLLAERWKALGLFPHATDVGAGRPGRDILNTDDVLVEVKATGRLSLVAQLEKIAKEGEEGDLPVVIWRHNGQGEKSMDKWTATIWLVDFDEYLRLRKNRNTGEK